MLVRLCSLVSSQNSCLIRQKHFQNPKENIVNEDDLGIQLKKSHSETKY